MCIKLTVPNDITLFVSLSYWDYLKKLSAKPKTYLSDFWICLWILRPEAIPDSPQHTTEVQLRLLPCAQLFIHYMQLLMVIHIVLALSWSFIYLHSLCCKI